MALAPNSTSADEGNAALSAKVIPPIIFFENGPDEEDAAPRAPELAGLKDLGPSPFSVTVLQTEEAQQKLTEHRRRRHSQTRR